MSSPKRPHRVVDLRSKKPGAHVPDTRPLSFTSGTSGRRVSPVRVRRRKRRLVFIASVFVLLLIGAGAVCYASYLPQYSVQTIDVVGAQAVPADAIRAYANGIIHDGSRHFISRANIFIFPKAVIEKDIATDFPRIASVNVSRPSLFSTTVTITVTERQSFALWCPSAPAGVAVQQCYSMDQSGFIFATADPSASSTGAYIFSGNLATSSNPIGETFAAGHMPGLVAFLQRLGQAGFSPMGAIVKSDQDFDVPLVAGLSASSSDFSIYASFGEDPDTLVNNLQLILSSNALSGQEQNLEYIDLRFGDKVYYKLKGDTQPQASTTQPQ